MIGPIVVWATIRVIGGKKMAETNNDARYCHSAWTGEWSGEWNFSPALPSWSRRGAGAG